MTAGGGALLPGDFQGLAYPHPPRNTPFPCLERQAGVEWTPPSAPTQPTNLPAHACRTLHFFASSDKAKRELGWVPKHTFTDDVAALVADYQKQGRQVGGGKMEKGRWGGRVGGG